jgi:hypothetical protein
MMARSWQLCLDQEHPMAAGEMKPMNEFDPTRTAVVYDRLNDKMISWKAEWQAIFASMRFLTMTGPSAGMASYWMDGDR